MRFERPEPRLPPAEGSESAVATTPERSSPWHHSPLLAIGDQSLRPVDAVPKGTRPKPEFATRNRSNKRPVEELAADGLMTEPVRLLQDCLVLLLRPPIGFPSTSAFALSLVRKDHRPSPPAAITCPRTRLKAWHRGHRGWRMSEPRAGWLVVAGQPWRARALADAATLPRQDWLSPRSLRARHQVSPRLPIRRCLSAKFP